MTTDVISSIQMLKRTRKAKRIHLYIKDRINFVKTNFDEIKDDYINREGVLQYVLWKATNLPLAKRQL